MANTYSGNTYISHIDYLRYPSGLETASLIGNQLRLSAPHVLGATTLNVTPTTVVSQIAYDQFTIFDGPYSEQGNFAASVTPGQSSFTIQPPGLNFAHTAGTPLCTDGVLGSIGDQIFAASAWLEGDFTYQPLFQATYTGETLPIPSMQASITNQNMLLFRPKHFPINSVSSIVLFQANGQQTTLDATQAVIDGNQQVVRVPILKGSGTANQVYFPQQSFNRTADQWVTISYSAGFTQATLPAEAVDAVILLVSEILSHRQNPTGADQIAEGRKNLVTTLRGDMTGESLLIKQARRKLVRYKVRTL